MTTAIHPRMIGRGATGIIYQLTDDVVVKRARKGEDEEADHAHEQEIFEYLEGRLPIPCLIRCIYRDRFNTFLEFASEGSLAMLLNRYQVRNQEFSAQVLEVHQTLPPKLIHRWMQQLCSAALGLADAGLAHGDVRPGNILFDHNWDLKLNDFDRTLAVGTDLTAVSEPFGRLLGKDDEDGAGTYGHASAYTENFAIGSIYYTLLRGHEPYEMEFWGTDHDAILIDKFQNMEFPALTDSPEDVVIRKCWNGEYESVKELWDEFADSREQEELRIENSTSWMELYAECQTIAKSGVLDSLVR